MVRIATVEDAEMILNLYSYYIEYTAITFEYTIPTVEEFRERIRKTLEKFPYLVYEERGKILGYAYAGTFNKRAAAAWMVETSVYVHRNEGGRGIGKVLYEELEKYLKKQNIITMIACITELEVANNYITKKSMEFHQHMGYKKAGKIRKAGYKFGTWYNLAFVQKQIGKYIQDPPEVISFPEVLEQEQA